MLTTIKKYKRLLVYLPVILILASAFFAGCSDDSSKATAEGQKIYYCPMHHEVVSDKPGVCPICHMDLVLRPDDSSAGNESTDGLIFSDRRQVLANISTVKVTSENIYKSVTAYSYLDFAEPNKKYITARFNGRIEKLLVDKTGDYIRKGQPLFEIYSPELVQAQNELLIASSGFQNTSLITASGVSQNENLVLNAAKQKLLLYGLTEKQIYDIESTKKVSYTLTYYSPFSGTVIEKKVQEGMYVNEGSVIYDIADLSSLWNIAEVYESDINVIKTGSKVHLQLDSYPGETFEGIVNLIYPVINAETRTVKIRSSFSNSRSRLRPNMYGQAVFAANLGEGLVIPEEAIIFTGKRKIVWVLVPSGDKENKAKTFEPRDVITGVKFDGKYQVLSGVKEGEEVAATGAYLIDSESQLKSGLSSGAPKKVETSENVKKEVKSDIPVTAGIWNKVCPVSGGEIDTEMKTVAYKGKTIGFCCPGCDEDFKSNPEKYMKNLSADGKTFIGKKEG